jgi:hypothetical protein
MAMHDDIDRFKDALAGERLAMAACMLGLGMCVSSVLLSAPVAVPALLLLSAWHAVSWRRERHRRLRAQCRIG